MAPCRIIVNSGSMQPTTVEGIPPVEGPPSSTSSILPSNWASTSCASRGLGPPDRLADVVASGPAARSSSRAKAWSGIRMPIEKSGDKLAGNSGRRGTTRVSAPGQNRSARRRAAGGTLAATSSSWLRSPINTAMALIGERSLALYSRSIAARSKSERPGRIPYRLETRSTGPGLIAAGRKAGPAASLWAVR